tara:strand:- start:632 stop:1105 length:474 start_codon:yes stop_codon:yes gene_type:complete
MINTMRKYYYNKITYLILISFFCILDQVSKIYINQNIDRLLNKDLIIFTIQFVRNYGAAFNIFSGSRLFLSFISIFSSLILFYFIFIRDNEVINKYGLSFILSGSIGNGLDRILNGYVIDFIEIKFIDFPVFNIADIVINIGVLILITGYIKTQKLI